VSVLGLFAALFFFFDLFFLFYLGECQIEGKQGEERQVSTIVDHVVL
jgi:hypothetical protein